MILRAILTFIVLTYSYSISLASTPPSQPTINSFEKIERLLVSDSVDFLEAKLTIDSLIDTKVDKKTVRSQINDMVSDVQEMLPETPTEIEKVLALRKYIYEAGEWNNFKPYAYDLDDPLGKSRTSRLLHNYLRTRKGNCVSMPILHAILGRKMGLDMTLSSAPQHVFIKFTNSDGNTVNIEATSGGYTSRNEWIKKNMPMTDVAIKNGVYLKTLSDREAVVLMASDLASHYLNQGEHEKVIRLSSTMLKYYPAAVDFYLAYGSAYYKLMEDEFHSKYPTLDSVPPEMAGKLNYMMQQNHLAFQKAEKLGWREPPPFIEQERSTDLLSLKE